MSLTYAEPHILKLLKLRTGPLLRESVSLGLIRLVEKELDGIVHRRPCCKDDRQNTTDLITKIEETLAETEEVWVSVLRLPQLPLLGGLPVQLAGAH